MDSVKTRIAHFNAERDPETLALKFAAMRRSAFTFLRGSCHLFYEDLPRSKLLHNAPLAWSCGDLHLENFGSYKGDNRLVYFDLNDFDEAELAPCTFDVLRLLTSILVAAKTMHVKHSQALSLCREFLWAFTDAIDSGKARWLERDTAQGLVRELLDKLRSRERKDFLDQRTTQNGRRRRISLDGTHALPATVGQKRRVRTFMAKFASTQVDPKFFKVLDVERRIAGLGSLGVERYVVLVEGKGSPDKNYLLDLKQARRSAMSATMGVKKRWWNSEAERVVTIQQRVQAIPTAFLHAVDFDGDSYILRDLQPSADRVSLDSRDLNLSDLKQFLATLGRLVAWGQLRSSGRDGSSTADELIEFWRKRKRSEKLLELAQKCADRTVQQWTEFCRNEV